MKVQDLLDIHQLHDELLASERMQEVDGDIDYLQMTGVRFGYYDKACSDYQWRDLRYSADEGTWYILDLDERKVSRLDAISSPLPALDDPVEDVMWQLAQYVFENHMIGSLDLIQIH